MGTLAERVLLAWPLCWWECPFWLWTGYDLHWRLACMLCVYDQLHFLVDT